MSGNDSPIPGNATVKIEQLKSFTSLQSQVTSPQKTMNETNTHFRYLLQNTNNETILEVNADEGPSCIGPLSGKFRYIAAQPEVDDKNWSLPLGRVPPNQSVDAEVDMNDDDASYEFVDGENNADIQTAVNTFWQAYNNKSSKLSNDEKLEMAKEVCNTLYDMADRWNGNTSKKQRRHRYSPK